MPAVPNMSEEYIAKIPALQLLMALGWHYVSPAECLKKRGGNREVILRDELVAFLQTRRFSYKGREYPLSPNAVEQIVREVSTPPMQEGLLTANERIYEKLCQGVTVTEFVDGHKINATIPLLDWSGLEAACPCANRFVVTEEMEVLAADGLHTRRPDIVGLSTACPSWCWKPRSPNPATPTKVWWMKASARASATRSMTKSRSYSYIPNFCWR